MANETRYNDGIQHGIDDNPNGDAEKGAALGGIGGAVTGLAAGAAAGPVGAILGAVIGGVAGAAASGAAVAAVDRIDNDNTISGLGRDATADLDEDDNSVYNSTGYATAPTFFTDDNGAQYFVDSDGHRIYTDETNRYYYTDINSGSRTYVPTPSWGNGVPGIQTGGYTQAGTPDSRGISEKFADAVTGDKYDDKQGVPVASADSNIHGVNRLPGEAAPSLKTGGYANDGTPDTRGVGEKFADAVTGDVIDDKTGKVVNHP